MAVLISEASKIIKALDKDNFNQITVDKEQLSNQFFSVAKYGKSSNPEKMEMLKTLIKKWRQYSKFPKVASSIMNIKSEAVVAGDRDVVMLDSSDLDSFNLRESEINKLKEVLPERFSRILKKVRFNQFGSKYFENWYVDGRLYVYIETDEDGIKDYRFLDPLKLTLVKKEKKLIYEYDTENNGEEKKLEIPYNKVYFISSGLENENGIVISYLNKAIRPINLLMMMENSLVIQRFVRAPERWVFKLDVSGMNKKRAKQYMENMRSKYRARFTIDAITGELSGNNMTLAMQENLYIPKTNSQNGGHDIDTIGGTQNLGDIDDILFWDRKVDEALHTPKTEGGEESIVSFGSRIEEISRAEYKFFRFIKMLRSYFNQLFNILLKVDVLAAGITKESVWEEIEDDLIFVYKNDSIYEENKERNKLENKFEFLQNYEQLLLKYYGETYIRKRILKQTDEEIKVSEKEKPKETEEEY